jgi:hypothetical protein
MKLIEAMNELKLTEKKLQAKLAFIQRYSARPNFRDDAFGGNESKKVAEAIQSANDLIGRHEELKRNIDFTNLVTKVRIGTKEYSIHSLILHKRFLCKLKASVYGSLNDSQAQSEVAQLRTRPGESKVNAQVIYNFDIMDRDAKQAELMELQSNIDSALQIANAKLDLKEAPKES